MTHSNSPDIVIRELVSDDYESVTALWRASDGVEVAEGDEREDILVYLQRNPGLSRVATSGTVLVGAVLCGHDGRRGLIYHLAVRPEFRGHGMGARLVQDCLAGLRTRGIKRALILVANDNAPGREFWRAQGFEEISGAAAFGVDIA